MQILGEFEHGGTWVPLDSYIYYGDVCEKQLSSDVFVRLVFLRHDLILTSLLINGSPHWPGMRSETICPRHNTSVGVFMTPSREHQQPTPMTRLRFPSLGRMSGSLMPTKWKSSVLSLSDRAN